MSTRRFIVEPRGLASPWLKLLVPIGSVFAALVVGAIFLALTGENPFSVYSEMVDAAFGTYPQRRRDAAHGHAADPDRCCRCDRFQDARVEHRR